MSINAFFPKRIVCLSHDSVETLLALGAEASIVGRPTGCRKEVLGHVATVGGYGHIDPEQVASLKPELVIGYSDFHHDVVAALVAKHITVLAQNHTTLAGIFQSILMLGGMTGRAIQAMSLVDDLKNTVETLVNKQRIGRRPRIYFEEWPEPATCGTRWISEIIHAAGGEDVFAERALNPGFAARTVTEDEVVRRDPEIIVASWCGRKLHREAMVSRPGWGNISAVKTDRIFEMRGSHILQPGPRVIEGLQKLHHIITAHFPEAG